MEIIKPTINQIADMTLEIMGLIKAYVEECKLPLDVNPDHIFAMLFEAAQNRDMYLIFAVDKGELVGYFLGAFHKELFTGKRTGNQYGFFCKQSHRHAVHALIKDFCQYSKSVGCRRIYLHVGAVEPVNRWQRVLKRSGFKPAEMAFVKEL